MIGYLNHLVNRYNEFKAWDCKQEGIPINYAFIRVAYQREMKYKVKDTPVELFDSAVAYLQRRIENTKLGRMKKGQGQKLFSSFDDFDRPHG